MKKATVVLTKGLPASGKSTWAKERIAQGKGTIKRINRDTLRSMLDDGVFSESKEKYIRKAELALAKQFLEAGVTIIVDDCNLSPSAMSMWQDFARNMNVTPGIQDFTDVPLETCIERDRKRPNYVGEQVIRRMYRDFLQPKPPVIERDPTLPDAIICDIDGTVALIKGRNPYNTAECIHDLLNKPVADIVLSYLGKGVIVLFTSGREDTYRTQTVWWLVDQGFARFNEECFLFMREAGDNRKDAVVKREIYEREIQGKYNVLFALDDRSRIVDLWRSLGLTCLQVAEGDF
jgi:predicted kinase